MKQFKIKSTKNIGKPQRKGQCTTTTLLKVNSSQFKFSAGLQDDIEDILDYQNLPEFTVEALNAIVSKLSKRNKFIKIAVRSPAGSATIAEYEDDLLASDSKDSKKIRQAQN